MSSRIDTLDWTHIHAFVVVAETGSLSAAARKTGRSQPTLGRHIKAAEAALGAELFHRVSHGLRLSETGETLIEPAREMLAASQRLTRLAAGADEAISGTVRLTASVVVSHFLLPEIIAELREAEPDIAIELVPSDATENLLYREADIALRMYRPTQLDLIARKITEHPVALYGARHLLEKTGHPKQMDDLAGMPFVGFDRSDLIIRSMRDVGFDVDRDFFDVRCDDQAAYWQLVRAGCGIGAMQTCIGDRDPSLIRLAPQPEIPPLPIWLAAHESAFGTPRVQRVWRFLVDRFKALAPSG